MKCAKQKQLALNVWIAPAQEFKNWQIIEITICRRNVNAFDFIKKNN